MDDLSVASYHKKAVAVVVGIAVLSGVAGTAAALTLTSLSVERISLFDSRTDDSNFNVDSYDTQVKGKDKVSVDVTVSNTDTTEHAANVTVQVLNETDAVLSEETKATGLVAGGDAVSFAYDFQQAGLASDYESSFIVVEDSS